jgi:hypothetical protein
LKWKYLHFVIQVPASGMRAAVGTELAIAHVTVTDDDSSPINRQAGCRLQQQSRRRRRDDVAVDGTAISRPPMFRLMPTYDDEYLLIFTRPPLDVVDSTSVVIECTDGDRQPVKRQLSIIIETNEVRLFYYLLINQFTAATVLNVYFYYCFIAIVFSSFVGPTALKFDKATRAKLINKRNN